MKILQIVDFPNWAIGKLSKAIVKYNPHLDFKVLYVHPKEVEEHIEEVKKNIDWADVIDFQYWRTASQLLKFIPKLASKKLILTHHNQKNLLSEEWGDMDLIVCHTNLAKEILEINGKYVNVIKVGYGIDMDVFEFNENYPPKKPIVGYCGRIVLWKGLKELARACYEIGYILKFMGRLDKPSYWEEIPEEHRKNIDMEFMNAPDEKRPDFYKSLTVFVGNSRNGREEGTLPLLEAMACGVPVVTTPTGMAKDFIKDGESASLIPFENYEALKTSIKNLIENEELRNKYRKNGWNAVKNFTEQKMAYEYEKIYHWVFSKEPLVSVIISALPDQIEQVNKILESLSNQDYKHIEAVVIFDQTITFENKLDLKEFNFPVKILSTGVVGGYNLARARNIGVIEAVGEYLVFCDSRICPEKEAIRVFVNKFLGLMEKEFVWYFGDKGGNKKSFVENFSIIDRQGFIDGGMCNERIDRYGGMSQELRSRFRKQGFRFEYVPEAKAVQLKTSKMTLQRRKDIIISKFKLWKMGAKG